MKDTNLKQNARPSSTGKLRGLFCVALAAVLAAGIALNATAVPVRAAQTGVKVVSSSTHTVALSGGALYGWGTNRWGQIPDLGEEYVAEPTDLKISGIADAAASVNRTLTVSDTGELRVYGLEPTDDSATAQDGKILASDAVQVAARDTFAAYVSKAGALYTWGKNDVGQLGNGRDTDSPTPVRVFEKDVKKVSLGDSFALALMNDGTVYGWGNNASLQLGSAGADSVNKPVKVAAGIADISAGYSHACLLSNNGALLTCGDNTYGQTGTGEGLSNKLTQILTGITSVSAGDRHNFAIASDGTVYAWGYGISGQLGNNSTERIQTPQAMDFNYIQVFASGDSTFAVSADGKIDSFGDNTNYLLGKADGSDSLTPVTILDSRMKWIYEEFRDAELEEANSNDPESETGGATTDAEEIPEVEEAPEVVSVPFISGDGQGHFLPEKNVTRAEFLRMVVSGLCAEFDPEEDYGTPSFSDIEIGRWYENYVAYAELNEIIVGDDTGRFRPTDPITKAEASVIVYKAMKLEDYEAVPSKFVDVATDRYFTKPIDALSAFSILNGDGTGYFYPQKNITRAEAATIIAQAAGYQPDDDAKAEVKKAFAGKTEFTDVDDTAWYYPYLLRGVGYVK